MWSHAVIAEVSICFIFKPGKIFGLALSSKTVHRSERWQALRVIKHGKPGNPGRSSTRPGKLSRNELEHYHFSWEKSRFLW